MAIERCSFSALITQRSFSESYVSFPFPFFLRQFVQTELYRIKYLGRFRRCENILSLKICPSLAIVSRAQVSAEAKIENKSISSTNRFYL